MATLTIRRLDDEVYRKLQDRARSKGRSLEAEVRDILADRARGTDSVVQRLRAFNEEMTAKHGFLSDSAALIRTMRDEE